MAESSASVTWDEGCGILPPAPIEPPATIVIFGASGDLAARKLVPALLALDRAGSLPPETAIVGVARRPWSDDGFRERMGESLAASVPAELWERFAARLHYHRLDFLGPDGWPELRARLEGIEGERGLPGDRIHYLSVAPGSAAPIAAHLRASGLTDPSGGAWSRVVFEKPFGTDLASATELSATLSQFLDEEQIYRIDHYLGKDTVQNILAFRLGNSVFEPLFHRSHVDHVQITVAESQGIEGGRGAYYDTAGALRDVLQNHVLQLACLVAMEPPAVGGPKEIRDEKVKVLQAIRPAGSVDAWAVRGQYGPGALSGTRLAGYREEERIAPESTTDTYAALRLQIENWRWAGVPFLLRTAKRMPVRRTEIAIVFRRPPTKLFRSVECVGDVCWLSSESPNALVFRIQPNEGVDLHLSMKRPGMHMDLHTVRMRMNYGETFPVRMPEAYERLLIDVLRGDQTLFARTDEIECAWRILTPVLDHWRGNPPTDFPNYPAGTWGPSEADRLTRGLARGWWNGPE